MAAMTVFSAAAVNLRTMAASESAGGSCRLPGSTVRAVGMSLNSSCISAMPMLASMAFLSLSVWGKNRMSVSFWFTRLYDPSHGMKKPCGRVISFHVRKRHADDEPRYREPYSSVKVV